MAANSRTYVDELRSLGKKHLLKNAIGCPCCESTTPIPTLDTSISTTKGKAKFGNNRTGALLIAFFSCSNALWASVVHVNWSFAKSCVKGVAIVAYPLMNRQ